MIDYGPIGDLGWRRGRSQPRIGNAHSAVFVAPAEECLLGYVVLAAEIADHHPIRIGLPQDPNHLLFGKSLIHSSLLVKNLHVDSLSYWLQSIRQASAGQLGSAARLS